MSRLSDLIDYYVNLLIIQYNNKPKARAHIKALVAELLASDVYFDVQDGYDINTAVGVQLDIIGKYVNLDRYYKGQNFDGFFSFINYDEVDAPPADRIGFADYTDYETKEGSWLNYIKSISEDLVLPDESFRQLIKLRIIQNASNHSHGSIDAAIYAAFADSLIPDSDGNMVMDYFVTFGGAPLAEVALQKGVLPKPIAVRLNYFIEQDSEYFGFATYAGIPDNIKGFADYTDYDIKEGKTLRYSNLLEV